MAFMRRSVTSVALKTPGRLESAEELGRHIKSWSGGKYDEHTQKDIR